METYVPNPDTAHNATIQNGRLFWIDSRESARPSLWTACEDGRKAEALVAGTDAITGYRVFGSARKIVVASDCGGDEHHQLRLFDLDTGDVRHLTSDPFVVNELGAVSPEGDLLAFGSNRARRDTMGISIINLEQNTRRDYAPGPGWWAVECWLPDGDALVVSHQRSHADIGLFRLDLDTGNVQCLAPFGPARFHNVTADGKDLILRTDWGQDNLYLARLNAGRLSPIHRVPGYDVDAFAWFADEQKFVATVNLEIGHAIHVGHVGGSSRELTRDLRCISDVKKAGPNAVLATEQSADQPARVIRIDTESDASTILIEPGSRLEGIASLEARRGTAVDGRQVPGLVYKPEKPNGAAVIVFHGGPESQWLPKCDPLVAEMCRSGWTVIAPNVRGSTGFGRNWASLDNTTLRSDVIGDGLAMRELVCELQHVDPSRVAVMGRSYGGFMTALMLAEEPQIWAASAILFGFADVPSIIPAFGAWRRSHRQCEYGDPADPTVAPILRDLSPLPRLGQGSAPVFLYHGRRDIRVPIEQTDMIEAKLREGGVHVTRMTADAEGHGFVERGTRTALWRAIIDHFAPELNQSTHTQQRGNPA